jgi:ferredoxin/flavodoxin---NADP+ reductase
MTQSRSSVNAARWTVVPATMLGDRVVTWIETKIARRRDWAPGLMSLSLEAQATAFVPGQFINLGLDLGESRVKRSYSLVSPPGEPCEVYLSLVPEGGLTPALFERGPGDSVWLDDRALGFFTLAHVPAAERLWMIATGTGLGPFMAMLRSATVWQRFERIVVVHGVRYVSHLGYASELARLVEEHPTQLAYAPAITREAPPPGVLSGRLPSLIANGELERGLEVRFEPARDHVLLCGNPAMISEVQSLLGARGLEKHRPRKAGQISIESYW